MTRTVQFGELKAEMLKIGFETPRGESDTYLEGVFVKAQLPDFLKKLEELFGPALWPSDQKIPPAIDKVIKEFGGIMGKQTLFGGEVNGRVVFVMLWPWNDGVHITLKAGEK
ncbi:MAG TPA: hypothetical protein P5110_02345 [Candidatus Omnitrophota bacterium]|nr:hypothetical protein [Candidatus Omnitrophota bacterium]HRZ14327.1 hypothetical protein [Candidatus Omnitrophota bacterium]